MVFADALLARRIEAAEAANARGCSPRGASVLEVAGGCAIFAGADSPLTQAVGIGLNGAVTEAQIGALETFFRSRGARPTIDLCPLADPGLLQALGERGYRPTEFNNVLVQAAGPLGNRAHAARAARAGRRGRSVVLHRGPRLLRPARAHHRGDGRGPRHLRHARSDVLSGGRGDRRQRRRSRSGHTPWPGNPVCRQHHRPVPLPWPASRADCRAAQRSHRAGLRYGHGFHRCPAAYRSAITSAPASRWSIPR